jgi:hypothetical protein
MSEPKARTKISCFEMFSENCEYINQFGTDLDEIWLDLSG